MSGRRYLDELYRSTFDADYEALLEEARKDPTEAEHHIRQLLKSLYVRQGNDWGGRGAVGDTRIDASIAAHESVLAELAMPGRDEKR